MIGALDATRTELVRGIYRPDMTEHVFNGSLGARFD